MAHKYVVALAIVILSAAARLTAQAATRIPVKVVVVTMFERGADTGDEPGEFQYWVERDKLDLVYPFPQGYRDLRMNRQGVLGRSEEHTSELQSPYDLVCRHL